MDKKSKNIKINTGFTHNFISKVLTKDIDCTECLLDLIDNSIDSARQLITQNKSHLKDDKGMPSSYDEFEIEIETTSTRISIYDNCSGVSPEVMVNRLFVVGEESNEPFSIGHFGVGLKRALLKLGSSYSIETRCNGETYRISCDKNDISDNADGSLEAEFVADKSSKHYTKIDINELTEECTREILDPKDWQKGMIRQLGIRYSIFIKKGLKINLNGTQIEHICPDVKPNTPVTIQKDSLNAPQGVKVFITAGMHEHYYKVGEEAYDSKKIQAITEEYGWYYVCNDRVIKIATIDKEYGWAKKWHPEYYGFVGWVYFVGNASSLPWNTKKTDIDSSSPVFEAIKGHLKQYADTYRSQNRGLKKSKNEPNAAEEENSYADEKSNEEKDNIVIPPEHSPADEYDNNEEKNGDGKKDDETKNEKEKLNYKPETKISESYAIVEKLNTLQSKKLSQLYNSLCKVSLNEHPSLMQVGAWAFFESLSRLIFQKSNNSFTANFNSRINQEWYKSDPAGIKPSLKNSLEYIHQEGNCVKHCSIYASIDAKPLANHFKVLEPLILKALDDAIEKKSQGFVPDELVRTITN